MVSNINVNYLINSKIITTSINNFRSADERGPIAFEVYTHVKPSPCDFKTRYEPEIVNAAAWADLEAIKGLIKQGAHVNEAEINICGRTAIHKAVNCAFFDHNPRIYQPMGFDIEQVERDGVSKERLEVIRLLLEAGANPNMVNENGETALILAVKSGILPLVQVVLEHGVDINLKQRDGTFTDQDGMPPLNWAVCRGHFEIVKVLVEAGAPLDAMTRTLKSHSTNDWEEKYTPLDLAIQRNHSEIIAYLQSVNAPKTEG